MKEIIELSIHMISSNLCFFPSPTGGINFSVLNSLKLAFFLLSIWSPTFSLSIFLFFFLIPSTVLFLYTVTLMMMQRDLSNAAITQTHRTVVHGRGVMANNCFPRVIFFSLFLSFYLNQVSGQDL